jgi:hypothetical protein
VAVDLPYARPARIGPLLEHDDGYAYLDRAYVLNDALAEAPPDYAFDYDDESPWVWETDDGFIRVVEVLPYGDRYFYFEPGEDYPFLIRDPDYAYAYGDGDLVAIYDSDGALLPPEDLMLHAPIAGRELARARSLFGPAVGQRQPVALAAWAQRRGQIGSELAGWRRQEDHQTGWRNYHQAHLRQEQAHWAPERFRREAETARVAQQVHDPGAAQHALREARRAQDVARRDHVSIPLQPKGRQTAAVAPAAMGVNGRGAGGRPAAAAQLRVEAARAGPELSTRSARAAPARPDRLAMALGGPGRRSQDNLRAQERAFDRPAEPHVRAAGRMQAQHQERPARAANEARAQGGRAAQAAREPPAAQLHIAMAQQNGRPNGGDHPQAAENHGGGGGDHGGGGGHQGGPPQTHGGGHGHDH